MEHPAFKNENIPEGTFDRAETIQAKSGRLAMATDAFMRERNEDRVFFDIERNTFAVVDGMGGYDHGDIAAESVVQAIKESLGSALSPQEMQIKAHEIMRKSGVRKGGACYVAGKIEKKKLSLWYAGDVTGMVINSKGEIKYKTENLGLADVPTGQRAGRAMTGVTELLNYDRLLIASDGLWDNVVLTEAVELVKTLSVAEALKALATLAEKGMSGQELSNGNYGNKDNLSILLYEILPVGLLR
jgi:serine/threonine protein phosphatase PrpC